MSTQFRQTGLALGFFIATAAVAAEGDSTLNGRLKDAFDSGKLEGLHSTLVFHRGEILAEAYFPGKDQRWGEPLGERDHGPNTLHDLRSVTKSIVGLLYGIALAEGKVPPVDARLIAQFPEYTDLSVDPRRGAIRIGDALSMRMGTEWNEDLPYTDPRNSEIAMELSKDRYRFVLDRAMVAVPGQQWTYNGGAVAIIAKLISDGVGKPIDDYAKEKLFDPLDITYFEWVRGADDVPSAASGLRLRARDLAKIGQLLAQKGIYDGNQVVPEDWLTSSFTPRASLGGIRYGYLWWLANWGDPPAWVAGFGNGGQRLTVQPEIDLVIVVFAGNYNEPEAWRLPVRIIENFVIPAVKN